MIATLLYLELACLLISLLSSAYEDVPSTSSVAINRESMLAHLVSYLAIEPFHRSAVQLTIIMLLSLLPGRIALLNAHHDPFGDLYPDGVWGEFDRSFSAFLSKNVVALASFNGEFIVVSKLVFLFIL